jgi:hypothetical protein
MGLDLIGGAALRGCAGEGAGTHTEAARTLRYDAALEEFPSIQRRYTA